MPVNALALMNRSLTVAPPSWPSSEKEDSARFGTALVGCAKLAAVSGHCICGLFKSMMEANTQAGMLLFFAKVALKMAVLLMSLTTIDSVALLPCSHWKDANSCSSNENWNAGGVYQGVCSAAMCCWTATRNGLVTCICLQQEQMHGVKGCIGSIT